MAYAVHRFFQERGFFYVHTPIITSSDCEGAGEMFQVTTLKPNTPTKPEQDFFGRPTYLTVSGQLQGEAFACALGNIYTFGPTFRAENSNTTRHAAEFWMIEPEMAFYDLTADMTLAEEQVRDGHAHVGEGHLAVAVRRVVVAEDREHALHAHAGRVPGHEHHGLLDVAVGVRGVRLAHEDEELAARVARAGREPLAGVVHVLVAVAHDAAGDVRGVRRGHVGLGHGEARADLAGQQRCQPALLLRGRAVAREHLHVARVRRAAVEHLGREGHRAHDLGHRRVLEVREPRAAVVAGEKEVPETLRAGLDLELVDHRRHGPAMAAELRLDDGLGGEHLGLHEALEAGLQRSRAIRLGKQRVDHGARIIEASDPAEEQGARDRA